MMLADGERIAKFVVEKLRPACSQIEVVGSIRRRRPFVHDIDIIAIPSNQGAFLVALKDFGHPWKAGPKLMQYSVAGASVDIYIADENSWPTLLLIRTGSAAHNVMLCARAKEMGMMLHADGSGIEGNGERRIPAGEKGIFEMLGLDYVPPEKREVR